MTRQEALTWAGSLMRAARRVRRERGPKQPQELLTAVLSAESDRALAVLQETVALNRFRTGQEVDRDSLDMAAITALGWLEYLRAVAQHRENGGPELSRALSILFTAYQVDPASVPRETLPVFIPIAPSPALSLVASRLQEHQVTREFEPLRQALDLLEATQAGPDQAAPLAEGWLDLLVSAQSALSMHHKVLFLRTGMREHLEQAVEICRTALARSPAEHWPELADQLSDCLRSQGESYGDLAAAEEAIALSREAVRRARAAGVVDPRMLSRLAVALRVAYTLSSALDRIDEAVRYGRQAVEQTPRDDPNWPLRAGNHATSLSMRHRLTERTRDIAEAVEWYTRAAELPLEPGHPDPGMPHSNLCEALRARYLPTTDIAGLTRAVEAGRRAVGLTPPEHVNYGLYTGNLAAALNTLTALTGDPGNADEALRMARASVAATPPGHAHFLLRLGALVAALIEKDRGTHDTATLEDCLRLLRKGLDAASPAHPDYPSALAVHVQILQELYRRTERRAYVEESVRALRVASEALSANRFDVGSVLCLLPLAWGEAVAAKVVAPEELARLVPVIRTHLRGSEPGSAERCEFLVALTNALIYQHQFDPRPELLDEAIATATEISSVGTQYHVHLPEYLVAQSIPFMQLYASYGDPVALTEAIAVLRRAHGLLAGLDHSRADVAQRLCVLLIYAVDFQGPTAVTDAIRYAREAVQLLPAGTRGHGNALTLLSAALQLHSDRTRSRRHLDEALAISRALLAQTPSDSTARPQYLWDLGLGLMRKARLDDDLRPLDEAVETFRTLTEAESADDPARPGHLAQLAQLYKARHDATGRVADLNAALDTYDEAARTPNASPQDLLLAGRSSAELHAARGDWGPAMKAYALAVGQLPFVVGPRLNRHTQDALLPDTTGVAIAAASCALELADPLRAVRMLEAGRATLITQAIDLRGPLATARGHAPHLAARWQQLRQEAAARFPENLVQRHGRAARWDTLRRELAELPGMPDLLAPISRAALSDATTEGPVVIVMAHGGRTDALLVQGGDVDAVRLALTEEDVGRAVGDLLRDQPEAATRPDAARRVTETLEWLWDEVAQPVLSALGLDITRTPQEAPRLWWCPTGLFTFLPLAAAGHHGCGDTVLDRVVSSFTPTIQALSHARRPEPCEAGGSFLCVGVPDAPGLPPLHGVSSEMASLRERFPDGVFLASRDATADRVLTRLAAADRAHFACHGVNSPYSPSSSCLVLHDGTELPVTDVSRLDLNAELAFLSACSTARGGYDVPDEAVTVASAFLLAGYRNVVGTLWSIHDTEAPHTAADFYHSLSPTTPPARALHEALQRARARVPERPDVWSAYVHYGA
ncbi:CHAT domain-containing protein [Streptomyces sp. NRRL S-1022]|uniref:CHAT domain-containing protein n=1 Tax=Streptomyces sp. NRRL S-1022 TaxID=1463880 RepID=UPI0004C256F6|nr:CHAT domain-containing protein [Streptomyces sp. NRRL S-1022]